MSDPFRIEGPALISFSGGRTSGYMLWRILQAYGGELPEGIHVQFCNTGKERAETLAFVFECGQRWGVKIHWLEWRPRPADVGAKRSFAAWLLADPERLMLIDEKGYAEVGFNSASRAGEPFMALIAMKQYAPNAVTRFCSSKLKVETAKAFAQAALGFTHWTNVVGLRHDEGHRILKMLARNDEGAEPYRSTAPLGKAKITKQDVLAFWWGPGRNFSTRSMPQDFDLELRSYEGNCDLCFLKSKEIKINIIRENPGLEAWWVAAERLARQKGTGKGGQFVTEYAVADLAKVAHGQTFFDFDQTEDEEYDAECGLVCG